MVADSGPFPPSALAANRAGNLTDDQRALLRTMARGVRRGELNIALFAIVFGIFLFFAVRPGSPLLVRVGIPIGCLFLAVFLLLRSLGGADKLTSDMRDPQVQSLEGPISRQVTQWDSGGPSGGRTDHYLTVAGQRFHVGRSAYEAAPEAGFVRIYFLPRSRHVVNLERLPDRTFAEGTTAADMAGQVRDALRSHDRARIDTVRAEAAGMGNMLQAAVSHDPVPPASPAGGALLAQQIVGSWSSGPVRVVFSPDGTVTVTVLGTNRRSGRWSVGADGKLHTDLAGREVETDAAIEGDQLSISLGDSAITLTRESA